MLELDRKSLELARDIANFSKTTYDSIHAAMMMNNGINIIVTEDVKDWLKIGEKWLEVAKVHNINIDQLEIFVPSRDLKH